MSLIIDRTTNNWKRTYKVQPQLCQEKCLFNYKHMRKFKNPYNRTDKTCKPDYSRFNHLKKIILKNVPFLKIKITWKMVLIRKLVFWVTFFSSPLHISFSADSSRTDLGIVFYNLNKTIRSSRPFWVYC